MILAESDFEYSKFYDDHEMTITVTGPRAVAATWEDIQAAVTIYRLEEPTKWFLRANEELASKLNKKTTTSTSRKFAVSFIRRQEEKKNFRVLWVPPRLKLEAVKKILKQHLGDNIELSRPAEVKDGSRIDVSIPMSNVEIPHYIPVKTNDGKSIQESLWFVSVFNRRQQCHYCEDETHWPSRCPNREKRENKIEKVLGRRKNQEVTVRRETDELIKNLHKKLQEERTMTYAQTVEKKKEKTSTETFKKPGHTVKPVEKKNERSQNYSKNK
ncbi:histone-lysine N-methyltransferase SETMAR-like protein [Plakobranchus ocellatus]|uniref:Histone-lysine N-methyltransferase SETMAR-like protein n=1 Tax=Plakobranchus ocellatus TaxID=259542 RepID=A0AAV3XVA5_9GAST|nr:histone-lysine N-methyltransferase SETMAR-like protein [Plakobranchus ocellatus]